MKKWLVCLILLCIGASSFARPIGPEFGIFDMKLTMTGLMDSKSGSGIMKQKVNGLLFLGNSMGEDNVLILYQKGQILPASTNVTVQIIGVDGSKGNASLMLGTDLFEGGGLIATTVGKYTLLDGEVFKKFSTKGVGILGETGLSLDEGPTLGLTIDIRHNFSLLKKLMMDGPDALVEYLIKKAKISEEEAIEVVEYIVGSIDPA